VGCASAASPRLFGEPPCNECKPNVAIIGAASADCAPRSCRGRAPGDVYEQATQFQRIGAGIQMSPNAMRVLRALGLEPQLRWLAHAAGVDDRVWDSGEHLSDLTSARRPSGGSARPTC
jgi:hypothetical protein